MVRFGTKVLLFGVALGVLSPGVSLRAAAPQEAMEKIAPWVQERTKGGAKADFFVVLRESADLSLAEQLPTKEAKGWFVYQALLDTAERTQMPVRAWLDAKGVQYRTFFIVNAILVEGGDREMVLALAQWDDVARIEGNPVIHNRLPIPADVEDEGARPLECPASSAPDQPEAVEWNISKVNAPGVWGLGYQGQGIVVGGQDTGYRWTHAALKGKYRGWNGTSADHNYNWHDAIHSGGGTCGANTIQPCDDYGHGTHTMGTVLGDDDGAGNQVGMAPQAQWIGCRDMNVGDGTPATYLECFQFFLAPTRLDGTGADPSRAPDLTTNSWGCPASEGCSWSTLQEAVNAQKAAGIMTVVSAGNSGSSCNTVRDPPAMYASAYTVGSTTSSDAMSGFSSRGPGTGTGLIKPNLVAPGSSVRSSSSASDTAYEWMSGTSMAAPNVAGGVALLWSARACYRRQQDATEALLNSTATKLTAITEACGGNYTTGPNNTWGNGLLNVYAAVTANHCAPPAETAPGTSSASMLGWTGKTAMGWPINLQATIYTVYRGMWADLPKLLNGEVDSCTKYTGSATSTNTLTEDPGGVAGGFYWYLVTGTNDGGEGTAGNATAGARVVNSSGSCP